MGHMVVAANIRTRPMPRSTLSKAKERGWGTDTGIMPLALSEVASTETRLMLLNVMDMDTPFSVGGTDTSIMPSTALQPGVGTPKTSSARAQRRRKEDIPKIAITCFEHDVGVVRAAYALYTARDTNAAKACERITKQGAGALRAAYALYTIIGTIAAKAGATFVAATLRSV